MSTTIYLVRHAEAEGNIGRRCHGHYDSMLTQRGLKQAEIETGRDKSCFCVFLVRCISLS